MAITVASVEASVIRLIGGFYTAVGKDITTTGANADLVDPMLRGFVEVTGTSPSDPSIVVDGDLAIITSSYDYILMVDIAAREALRSAMGLMTSVDTDVGDGSIKMSQLLVSARLLLADLIKKTSMAKTNQITVYVSSITKGYPMPNDPLRPENWDYYTVTYP